MLSVGVHLVTAPALLCPVVVRPSRSLCHNTPLPVGGPLGPAAPHSPVLLRLSTLSAACFLLEPCAVGWEVFRDVWLHMPNPPEVGLWSGIIGHDGVSSRSIVLVVHAAEGLDQPESVLLGV